MRCVECAREHDPAERGWVTVLSPSGSIRIRYCPECMVDLLRRANTVDDDGPGEGNGCPDAGNA